MNCLMLIPFGHILEGNAGSKHTFTVFAAAALLSSITFQILMHSQDELARGVIQAKDDSPFPVT